MGTTEAVVVRTTESILLASVEAFVGRYCVLPGEHERTAVALWVLHTWAYRHNLRQRVVAPVVKKADELLAEREQYPLPAGLSPHKLRHCFASVLVALGNDPAYVMGQLGHTDPVFTLRVYTHMMRRDGGERDALRALVHGADWAANGQPDPIHWAVNGQWAAGRPVATPAESAA